MRARSYATEENFSPINYLCLIKVIFITIYLAPVQENSILDKEISVYATAMTHSK